MTLTDALTFLVTNTAPPVIIIGLVGWVVWRQFLFPYFNAKAGNLASKEDLGEITQIIEEVKAQLVVSSSAKISHTERKKPIIEDWCISFQSYRDCLNTSWPIELSYESLTLSREIVAKSRLRLNERTTLFNLYIDNLDLLDKMQGLQVGLQQEVQLYNRGMAALSGLTERRARIGIGGEFKDGDVDLIKNLLSEMRKIFESSQAESLEIHKKIIPLELQFIEDCKSYLNPEL